MIVGAIGWGFYRVSSALVEFVGKQNGEVTSALIVGATTIVVAVLSVVMGKVYERKLEIERSQRERNGPMYEALIGAIFSILLRKKEDGEIDQEKFKEAFIEFNKQIILWGGDDTIKAWSGFRVKAQESLPPDQMLDEFENLIKAFRKEYGHKNRGLERGVISRTFISDYDKYIHSVKGE